jgi:hypothetical protein
MEAAKTVGWGGWSAEKVTFVISLLFSKRLLLLLPGYA